LNIYKFGKQAKPCKHYFCSLTCENNMQQRGKRHPEHVFIPLKLKSHFSQIALKADQQDGTKSSNCQ
ncbi:hypothetical protein, partial [Endozoicomonas sp. SESOKO4]|uniref:hypothetical protein n=1 Tax=Endozoicomonas sp. SESOKO4 TaxID=2828745 RepID=UPI0021479446